MDKKQLYITLSHTTKFNHIHLDKKLLNECYINCQLSELELVNTKQNSPFKNGKVYEVIFDNESAYVGSKSQELETRLKWHKNNKSQVYKYKNNKPDIR